MQHALPSTNLNGCGSVHVRDVRAVHRSGVQPATAHLGVSMTASCQFHATAAAGPSPNRRGRLQQCSSIGSSTAWPSQQLRSPTCTQTKSSSRSSSSTLRVSRHSKSRLIACASAPSSQVSTAQNSSSSTAAAASPAATPAASSVAAAADVGKQLSSADQGQQISGLAELVRQQQAAINELHQEVLQLRSLAGALQESAAGPLQESSSSQAAPAAAATNGSSAASSPARTASRILNLQHQQQYQQQLQKLAYGGSYKAMTLEDFRALPDKIILVRHAESQGNVDARIYSTTPDYEVPLSARGWEQAVACGDDIRGLMEAEHGAGYKLFFMTSPYCRTRQTFVGVRQAFPDENFAGVQEEVQLREQDFGNFQNPDKIKADLAERNRFGRFYYRFPGGESGSDVYNRVSIFEDHLIRDMKAGRFSSSTSLCLVTHGLTMRVFLMRWFNWTVESFLQVYNPPNAKAIVVEKMGEEEFISKTSRLHERRQTLQVKNAYRLRKDSMARLKMESADTTKTMDQGAFH